ncbi:hypothetical protein HRI_002595800 [Hibiscus trionum]|uniref:Uncharacterized protein n=1 Tax=Hibiscus trionum TaxID=183268 RepID=A0A9W7I3B4_HIBTR|nr:hypothetical protein HRI_002595800 [Hibiscus trionum]
MASSDKELELVLMEAGNKLLEPPSSVDELITLLDQVESFLSRVEQSPSKSMQNALSPSHKALIGEQLFRHPDDDVKVAVAACISEITRISAPEAPYVDDQMREVFQLIVASFENLSDKSSRSYIKRTSILETVAKVRSCVVMLDLECDALIIEMFQHFLNAIRDYHADTVFTSMVTIMALVFEESEDISMELLSPILARVKRDNEEILPIARRLAKSVLETCASKLKPYLTQAVENSGIPFEDYSSVVASICQVALNDVVQNDTATEKQVDVASKPAEAPLGNAVQEDKEIPKEPVLTEQVEHANEKSPTSVFSNGIIQTDENNSLPDSNSLKKQEDDCLADKSENVDMSTVAEPDESEGEKVVISDSKLEQSTEEKGGKSHSKSTEPSESIHVDGKEVETLTDQKDDSKDDAHPPCKDPSVDGAVSMENKRATDVQPSLTKATEDESNDVASPAPSGTIHDESHSKKAARPKKKDGSCKKITSAADDVSKKSSEVKSDLEAKTNKRPGKRVASVVLNKNSETKKESGTASDSEETPLKLLSKKLDSSSKNADGSSSRKPEDKKNRARGKLILPEKDRTKISTRNDDEEMVGPKAVEPNKNDSDIDETPKTSSKRKHTQSKEKGSDTLEYDENLVGLKVKVWWPMDSTFYDGVIQSFDRIRKKHKVCYDDGDVEILNLKREKWEVIKDESGSDEEVAADHPSPDGSSEISEKKKAKAADQPRKQPKMDAWPKRGGGASSGKSKGAATKSGSKIKDGKVGGSKSVGKSDNVTKAKDHTPKTGSRPVHVASKVGSKSKNEASVDTPKSTIPIDDDKPMDDDNVTKAKDHTPESGSTSVDVASKADGKSKNEDSVDTPKSMKPKDAASKVSSKSKNEDSVDTPKSTKPKDAASKVSSRSKTEDSVDTPKSTKPKGDDKPKDAASKVSRKSKNEDSVDTPKSTKPKGDDKPKGTASKVSSKSKNEDSVDTPKSTKPKGDDKLKDTASKVSSKSKKDDSVDTPKSTKPKGDDKLKDSPSKVSSKSKNEDGVDTPKSTKPKGDDKSQDAPSKVSSKSKNEDSAETPKSTKPRDDDNVMLKATTKPKPDTSKTAKSKQETPKVSSNAKGKPLKSGGKSDANGGGKSKSDSTKVKESDSMKDNSIDLAEAVVTFKRKKRSSEGQGSDSKSVKKLREELKATSTAES